MVYHARRAASRMHICLYEDWCSGRDFEKALQLVEAGCRDLSENSSAGPYGKGLGGGN